MGAPNRTLAASPAPLPPHRSPLAGAEGDGSAADHPADQGQDPDQARLGAGPVPAGPPDVGVFGRCGNPWPGGACGPVRQALRRCSPHGPALIAAMEPQPCDAVAHGFSSSRPASVKTPLQIEQVSTATGIQ